ncbi:MAG TPA: hypothetical protein VGR67_00205 [Candidatus Polarisedimenticolia bacterium]|nr:hypothetical protein [Candidatus Polarisedimenticolia bacterium]
MSRKETWRALGALLGTAAAFAPLAWLAAHALSGPRGVLSAALGAGLAIALALAGTALQIWAFQKPQKVFLAAIVGSLLGRMAIFLSALAAVVAATRLPPAPFVAALFFYYVLCQVLEIRTVRRIGVASR